MQHEAVLEVRNKVPSTHTCHWAPRHNNLCPAVPVSANRFRLLLPAMLQKNIVRADNIVTLHFVYGIIIATVRIIAVIICLAIVILLCVA